MPFNRFRTPDGRNVDTVLGPEMQSTGEVMGFDADFGTAFAKSQTAAFGSLPTSGKVFVSMANRDKRTMIFPIKVLADRGFEILATQGTAEVLRRNGVTATVVRKHFEGPGPNGEPTTVQLIQAGEIDLIVNTPHGVVGRRLGADRRLRDPHRGRDGQRPVHHHGAGAGGAVQGIEALRGGGDRGAVAAGLGASVTAPTDALRPRRWRTSTPRQRTGLGLPSAPVGTPGGAGARRPEPPTGHGDGARLPRPARAGGRLRQERRGHRRPRGAGVLLRRGRHRHRRAAARERPAAAVPAARRPRDREPDGVQQRRRRGGRRAARTAAAAPGTLAAPRLGGGRREHRQDQGRARDDPAAVVADYEKSTRLLAPYADYLVVNVSSPNTPGLRDLQAVERLGPLLRAVRLQADAVTVAPEGRGGCRCW